MLNDPLDPVSFRPIVGIDLGTTNSAVAYIREGKPHVIAAENGQTLLPSVVLIDPNQQVIVGQDARDGLIAMPERTIAAVKRLMGQEDPITLAEQQFLPEEISALILKELRSWLKPVFGDEESIEAVITVPAYFNDAQRRATKQAGELAGFVVERIINEPTAAALAYGLDHSETARNILVYDLGGGTFDVSVVTLDSGVLEVRASNGNRRLGGEDFDWRLVDWMAEQIMAEEHVDPREDLRARAILKDLAEKVKWTLSDHSQAVVESPVLMVHDGHPVMLDTHIRRQQFVSMIQPWLDETFTLVEDVLRQANLSADAIDDVLLVGGSTRIPRVRDMAADYFGHPARVEVDPDLAVALGAAVQAGIKSGALSHAGLVATDVAPFSMGIATARPSWRGWQPGYFEPIIVRNTAIPCTRSKTFTTVDDGQDTIEVEVFQGEDERVSRNYPLGSFRLTGIPKAPAGMEKVDVTFRYNLNGILEATARITSTRFAKSLVVQDGLERRSQEALEQSRRRLEALWAGDASLDEASDLDTVINVSAQDVSTVVDEKEDLVGEIKAMMADLQSLMADHPASKQRKAIQDLLVRAAAALATNDDEALQAVIDQGTDFLLEAGSFDL